MTSQNRSLSTSLFWLAAAIAAVALYCLCLRFLFPGYFDPLSAFHVDFYDYFAAREIPLFRLLSGYPRPAAYLTMKVMAYGGLMGLLCGGVAMVLLNVLLTLALARKLLHLQGIWLLAAFVIYSVLLFAHPDFYVEHRHDLPVEASYLSLLVSLLTWMSYLEHRGRKAGLALLSVALLSAVFFAFAKETYFISALCLMAGLALANRTDRWRHAAFGAFLFAAECCSLAWTRHINGPFVNLNSGADSTYQISLAPASVVKGFLFYVTHLLNPALVLITILGMAALWKARPQFLLGISFLAAGLAAFATHAMLPHHLFVEYAWVAAPLFLVPVLAIASNLYHRGGQLALAGLLAVFAIAGPSGYGQSYATKEAKWIVTEDQKGSEIAAGLSSYREVPRPARILVVGLEDTNLPWESQGFVRVEFGERLFWLVAMPPSIRYRRNSRLVRFVDASKIERGEFDYVATYQPGGNLVSIRAVAAIPASEPLIETLVPELAPLQAASRAQPGNYAPLLQAAAVAIDWGFRDEAGKFLEQARQRGGADATYRRLMAEAKTGTNEPPKPQHAELVVQASPNSPSDHTGLYIAELSWKVPEGIYFEIHVNTPNGPLFLAGETSGHAQTEKWVKDGMEFFLQDVTGGKPLTKENALAHATSGGPR